MAFRDLKIGIKHGLGFSVILVVLAGVSVFAIIQMGALRQEIDDINEFWLERALVSSRLNVNASALRNIQMQHALAQTDAQRDVYADSINRLIDEIYTGNLDNYAVLIEEAKANPLFSEEEEQLSAEIEELWDEYLLMTLEVVDLQGEEALTYLDGEMGALFTDFSTKIKQLVAFNEASAAAAARRAETTYTTTRNRIIILLIATVLLSGIIAAQLVRLIVLPVRHLVRAARRVAEGNFNVHLDNQSKDEIGTLTRSFEWMTQSLKNQQDDLKTKNQDLEQALYQLRDTQQQLILKEKMASLGQLTAGIAHEIKNPLNFVNNFAALSIELADDLSDELVAHKDASVAAVWEEVEAILQDLQFNASKIREHGERADRIVRGMLEHSRGKASERRVQALNPLVDEYTNLAFHGMRAGQPTFNATLERDLDDAVGEIDMVPQELGRVLLNLLNNAFYAVHQRQLASEGAYTPCVHVSTHALGETVEIRVTDNGGGIPKAIRDRIFEPFFTTKPTGTGNTGLGLSLSFEIITQGHGGMLAVESEVGESTTFIVTLPAKPH